ncbi:MAG: hypothetical protein ABGY71_04640 [bacterium]|jgi:hypothetical protein|nr:hypothetical protein [Planctomycetota bacterium]HIL52450.1 hypothetical protein [Planctomycetota bacterium]
MVDPNPIQRQSAASIRPAQGNLADTRAPNERSNAGPAFQALLEKLQLQAQKLQHDSESVVQPDELQGAVNRAHDSLENVLSLSEQLLEAYRESQQVSRSAAADDLA